MRKAALGTLVSMSGMHILCANDAASTLYVHMTKHKRLQGSNGKAVAVMASFACLEMA